MKNIKIKPSYIFLLLLTIAAIVFFRVHDSSERVNRMISAAQKKESALPLSFNQTVQSALTRRLQQNSSADIQKMICRYEKYKVLVEDALRENHIPAELSAIPANSTGYENIRGMENSGIWHLSLLTAQMYGLIVDEKIDERLDMNKSSKAVSHYLAVLYEMFHDWNLVILSYHFGEGTIMSEIRELNTRDAWVIEKKLTPEDSYLSRVMATVILMKNEVCDANSAGR